MSSPEFSGKDRNELVWAFSDLVSKMEKQQEAYKSDALVSGSFGTAITELQNIRVNLLQTIDAHLANQQDSDYPTFH